MKNPVLSTRVSVAVNLILATVNTFGALIPENAVSDSSQRTAARQVAVAAPKDLKRQWNQQLSSRAVKEMGDSVLSACLVQCSSHKNHKLEPEIVLT